MENLPKLILINGFAGVGKTTLSQYYIERHPLSLSIEGDEIIVMIGQWTTHEKEAREYVFELIKSMITTHLRSQRTVLLPYLLTNASHAEAFETIAKTYNVDFFEIFLSVDKDDAIERLLERGTWGETGLPPITKKDLPIIHRDYDLMMKETAKRPNTINIHPYKNDIEKTYLSFLKVIGESV